MSQERGREVGGWGVGGWGVERFEQVSRMGALIQSNLEKILIQAIRVNSEQCNSAKVRLATEGNTYAHFFLALEIVSFGY